MECLGYQNLESCGISKVVIEQLCTRTGLTQGLELDTISYEGCFVPDGVTSNSVLRGQNRESSIHQYKWVCMYCVCWCPCMPCLSTRLYCTF